MKRTSRQSLQPGDAYVLADFDPKNVRIHLVTSRGRGGLYYLYFSSGVVDLANHPFDKDLVVEVL